MRTQFKSNLLKRLAAAIQALAASVILACQANPVGPTDPGDELRDGQRPQQVESNGDEGTEWNPFGKRPV